MSEFVEKIIKEAGEEIKEETIKEINRAAERATERFQRIIETLKEQAKIVLPVNVIDILAKGGQVCIKEVNVPYDGTCFHVAVETRGDIIRGGHGDPFPSLKAGKYRVILIMERLGPPEREDC